MFQARPKLWHQIDTRLQADSLTQKYKQWMATGYDGRWMWEYLNTFQENQKYLEKTVKHTQQGRRVVE